jgi:hypothetical protein
MSDIVVFDMRSGEAVRRAETPAESAAREAAKAVEDAARTKADAHEARIRALAIKCAKHAKTGTNAPTEREQSELLARLALAAAADDQ